VTRVDHLEGVEFEGKEEKGALSSLAPIGPSAWEDEYNAREMWSKSIARIAFRYFGKHRQISGWVDLKEFRAVPEQQVHFKSISIVRPTVVAPPRPLTYP